MLRRATIRLAAIVLENFREFCERFTKTQRQHQQYARILNHTDYDSILSIIRVFGY